MKYKQLFALIFACMLLLALAACQQTPVETTAPSTEPPTTAPTEPPAEEVYADAVAAAEGMGNILLRVSMSQTIEVSGETFTTDSSQTITYINYGKDDFRASVKENAAFCDYSAAFTEIYADGKVYTKVSGINYISELTEIDYTELYSPIALMDAALYEVITQEGSLITFSQPTALEEWMAPDGAELMEASGTATLDGDNKLSAATYDAVYQYGPSKITESYQVTIGTPNNTEITVPEDTSDYVPCNGVGALWMYERAIGFLENTDKVTSQTLRSVVSQAAGYTLTQQTYMDAYTQDSGVIYRVEKSVNESSNGNTYTLELEETYKDGILTSITDGGEPEAFGYPLAAMQNYFYGLLTENFLNAEGISQITCTDTGTLLLLEFTTTEDFGKEYQNQLCFELFRNATALDDLASEYKTDKMEVYFSIDKYTGTPVALGITFEGIHTVEEKDYLLSCQLDQNFELPSQSAYTTITDEKLPEAEPEEKATPLFYHVTGSNGQEMWLFGTIHVGDERTAYLPQEIYDAFDASDALAIECDNDGFQEKLDGNELMQNLVSASYYYMGTTIESHLDTPELYDHAKQLMKATGNYFYNSEYMKAYLWSNSIDNYYLAQGRQLTSEKGVESRLTDRAKEKDIPLREVESVIFQIQMFGGYSGELQEFLLYSSVASNGQENWEGTMELYELWCAGNETELMAYLNEDAPWELTEEDFDTEGLTEEELQEVNDILSRLDKINAELAKIEEEYNTKMSTGRNAGMLEVAKEYLESGDVVFFAVGLAHVIAEDGLVNTLRDAGYTVELVTYA